MQHSEVSCSANSALSVRFSSFLHVGGLLALALAQPVYDLLSRQAEFFVARNSQPIDIVSLVALLSVVAPFLASLPMLAASTLGGWVWSATRLVTLGGLLFMLSVMYTTDLLESTAGVLTLATLAAVGLTILYHRFAWARTFFSALSVSIILVPLLFLGSPRIRALLFAQPEQPLISPSSGGPSVVLLVFDELPLASLLKEPGRIDRGRFPNFAAFADTAVWYSEATSPVPVTNYAVPAILSGLYPDRPRLPIQTAYPQNLFTYLAASHNLFVHESATRLCPPRLCTELAEAEAYYSRMRSLLQDLSVVYLHLVLPEALTHHLPSVANRWQGFGEPALHEEVTDAPDPMDVVRALKEDRVSLFRQLLAKIQGDRERPTLYFLHHLFPHTPWAYYPSLVRYTLDDPDRVAGLDSAGLLWRPDPWMVTMGQQRHLLQLGALDTLIGELLQKLKDEGIFDETLVILVADHGASFRTGGAYRKLTEENLAAIATVPLFIKYPFQTEGSLDHRLAETVDVFPTIVDVLGGQLESPVDGHSLRATNDGSGRRKVRRAWTFFSEWRDETVEFTSLGSRLERLVEQRVRVFGSGDWESVYRVGPEPDLVGAQVDGLAMSGPSGLRASLRETAMFEDVVANEHFVPGLVHGTIESSPEYNLSLEEPLKIAVAVNGTIRAVAMTSREPSGALIFSAVLPEESFRSGSHRVEAFRIMEHGGQQALSPLGGEPADLALARDPKTGAERIESASNRIITIQEGAVAGFVDTAEQHESALELSGWAIDRVAHRPAARILVFIDGRLAFAGRGEAKYRPDMETHYGLPWAGYRLFASSRGLNERSEVRVFGVSAEGVASELAYHEWFRWR